MFQALAALGSNRHTAVISGIPCRSDSPYCQRLLVQLACPTGPASWTIPVLGCYPGLAQEVLSPLQVTQVFYGDSRLVNLGKWDEDVGVFDALN